MNAERKARQAATRQRILDERAAAQAARKACKRTCDAARYAADPERSKARSIRWRADSPGRAGEYRAKRRAAKREARPDDYSDFDEFVMREAVEACKRREAMTGYPWHADHLVPLSCGGAHGYRNWQVIPASLNLLKHAHMILTEPGEWVKMMPGA